MELKDFVSETLKQIMEGVKGAQDKAAEMGGAINPRGFINSDNRAIRGPFGEPAQLINFDVVVSTNDVDKAKGGVGIFVGDIGVGVRGEAESQSTAVNRIQFSVPVFLPTQQLTKE